MTDPDDIKGWQRLDPQTTTSGLLEPRDVARLKAAGVRHVVNLALIDSPGALEQEAEVIAKAGMGYSHIPVPFDAPDEAHYRAFVTVMAGAERPIHVHCIMNWRVSALFYRLHRENGMDEGQARDLMERQWSPWTSENPAAPAWVKFIEGHEPT